MGHKIDTADARIDEISRRQHGVVTVAQLEAIGLSRHAVAKRANKGRLHRMHRGVYAVGHKGLSWHGRWMAAVLACGDGAVLSHGSAAALWGLLRPINGPVHVSTPSTSGRSKRRGIHLHRAPSLIPPTQRPPSPTETPQGPPSPAEPFQRPSYPTETPPSPSYPASEGGRRGSLLTTHRDNIPTTTVPRTIEDLRASSLPEYLVRRAIRQAELKGLRLEGIETDRTRSDLETAFLALFAHHRLPPPEVNPKIGRYEVDFLWREERLVVEADTFAYHQGSIAFEDDHARDSDLRRQGYAVLRFTDKQLEAQPERIAADVRSELAARRR
jgi:very-short-patch-repair endonuclease